MKYLLLICTEGGPLNATPAELDVQGWLDEVVPSGIRLTGDRLAGAADATTVRVRDGEVLLSDGPYAETKEQMGGFDVIECADLDEAISVAAKHPIAKFGMIEVRPFWTE